MKIVNGVTLQPEAWQPFATRAAVVTPSDTVPLSDMTRFIVAAVAGNIAVIMAGDPAAAPVVIPIAAGIALPIAAVQVMATGTTATGIVALI